MHSSKQQLAILMALKHGIDEHITLDGVLERFARHDVVKRSAMWARERQRFSESGTFEDFVDAIADLLDEQVIRILKVVGSRNGVNHPLAAALEYVRITAPIVGENHKEQLAIVIALKGAFKAGRPLVETASIIKSLGAGPGSGAWAQLGELIRPEDSYQSFLETLRAPLGSEVVDIMVALAGSGSSIGNLDIATEYLRVASYMPS